MAELVKMLLGSRYTQGHGEGAHLGQIDRHATLNSGQYVVNTVKILPELCGIYHKFSSTNQVCSNKCSQPTDICMMPTCVAKTKPVHAEKPQQNRVDQCVDKIMPRVPDKTVTTTTCTTQQLKYVQNTNNIAAMHIQYLHAHTGSFGVFKICINVTLVQENGSSTGIGKMASSNLSLRFGR